MQKNCQALTSRKKSRKILKNQTPKLLAKPGTVAPTLFHDFRSPTVGRLFPASPRKFSQKFLIPLKPLNEGSQKE